MTVGCRLGERTTGRNQKKTAHIPEGEWKLPVSFQAAIGVISQKHNHSHTPQHRAYSWTSQAIAHSQSISSKYLFLMDCEHTSTFVDACQYPSFPFLQWNVKSTMSGASLRRTQTQICLVLSVGSWAKPHSLWFIHIYKMWIMLIFLLHK